MEQSAAQERESRRLADERMRSLQEREKRRLEQAELLMQERLQLNMQKKEEMDAKIKNATEKAQQFVQSQRDMFKRKETNAQRIRRE